MFDGDTLDKKIADSEQALQRVLEEYQPDYIVSMVSGGKDSAASHAIAEHLGIKFDLIIHGNTRTGIPETNRFVEEYYGNLGPNFEVADAGSAYEDYVLNKGFFGVGVGAHMYSYHILKAAPFSKVISRTLRQGKRGVKILFINGARRHESTNRKKHLQQVRLDPTQKKNIWFSILYDFTKDERDSLLDRFQVPINPVAKNLCKSGECMCGTMQSKAERVEAACLYPEWGQWLDNLEQEVIKKHGVGWGQPYNRKKNATSYQLPEEHFEPMCADCVERDDN